MRSLTGFVCFLLPLTLGGCLVEHCKVYPEHCGVADEDSGSTSSSTGTSGSVGNGDGDGDPGGSDDPGGDPDMDGVASSSDNCLDDPNPNQLDFDSDGTGNVCDPLLFTVGGGSLQTMASASAAGDSCELLIDLEVLAGKVLVQLDDNAVVAGVELVEIDLADVPEQNCMLILGIATEIDLSLSISDFTISNGGDPLPTSVPHNQADHDNGVLDGMQDMEHPIQVTGTITASIDNGMPSDTPLDSAGQVPPAAVLVTNAGGNIDLTFNDPDFVVVGETPISMDLPVDVQLVLSGLGGTLTMTH